MAEPVTVTAPFISIDAAMRGGQPTINGTCILVAAVAGMVWAEDVDTVMHEYDLTRHDILVCCWHAGMVGLPGARSRRLTPTRLWRDRWGGWAQQVHGKLWSASALDVDAVPNPPASPHR